MKTVLLSLIVSFLLGCNSDSNSASSKKGTKEVLICISPNAYSYHSHYCHGLNNCEHEVKEVSLEEAKSMHRRPCGYCY